MKKIISFILIITMVLNNVAISYANETTWDIDGNHQVDNQKELEFYTEQVLQQPIVIKKNGEYLIVNYDTYRKYDQIIVYGQPFTDSSEVEYYNKDKNRMEQRYLGYDKNGTPVLNTYWVDIDVPVSSKMPDQWNYISKGYGYSWEKIQKRDPNLYDYMLQAPLKGNDYNYNFENPNFNVLYINKLNNSSYHPGYLDRTKLSLEGSWKNGFVIDTNTKSNGRVYYQTWNGPPMADGLTFTKKLDVQKEYTMFANENSVTIPVTIKVTANLPNKWTKESDINYFGIEFRGQKVATERSNIVEMKDIEITFNRSELRLGDNNIDLEAKAELRTTYGDVYGINITGNTLIHVEEAQDPYITLISKAEPFAKIWEGEDIVPVAIEVESHVFGVNPEDIIAYALKVDDKYSYAVQKNDEAHTLFNAGIDCSALKSNEEQKYIDKRWKITAEAVLKDGTILKIEDEEQTLIIRPDAPNPSEPEEPVIEPPVVTVRGKDVKLGDPAYFSTYAKSPHGLDINTYEWVIDGDYQPQFDNKKSATHYFDKVGKKTIEVGVEDSKGLWGYGDTEIDVLPPTVDAAISIDGILKVNRAIEVNTNGSDSPEKYPIADNKTNWTVNTSNNLQYKDSNIDGNKAFDFFSRTPGQIDISVYLENTAGYSDTAAKTITIAPDEPPVADFTSLGVVYRQADNYNKATLSIFNKSYSPDGDKLGNLKVWITFDGNNNGSFNDAEDYKELAYNGPNIPIIEYEVYSVGKYKVELAVTETYETLPGFENTVTYLSDYTSDKPIDECIIEVDNLPPSMNMELLNRQPIDLNFQLGDFNGMTKGELESYINSTLSPRLEAEGYQVNSYDILDESMDLKTTDIYNVRANFDVGSIFDRDDDEWDQFGNLVIFCDNENDPDHQGEINIFDLENEKHISFRRPFSMDDGHSHETKYYFRKRSTENNLYFFWVGYEWWTGNTKEYDIEYWTTIVDIDTLEITNIQLASTINSDSGKDPIYAVPTLDDKYIVFRYSNDADYDREYLALYDIEKRTIVKQERLQYEPLYIDISNRYIRTNNYRYYIDLETFSIVNSSGIKIDKWIEWNDGFYLGFDIYPITYSWDYILGEDRKYDYLYYRQDDSLGVKTNLIQLDYEGGYRNAYYDYTYDGSTCHTPTRSYLFGEFYHEYKKGKTVRYWDMYKMVITTNTNDYLNSINNSEDNRYFILIEDNVNILNEPIYTNEIVDNLIQKDISAFVITNSNNENSKYIANSTNGFTVDNMDLFTEELISSLNDKFKSTKVGDTIYLTCEEEYEFDSMYWDYENDPMFSGGYKLTHTDPHYFENSNGTYPYSGQYKTINNGDKLTIQQVGKYEFEPSVQDNPSDNPDFAYYRKWSDDGNKNTLIVHRRPIADFEITFYDGGYLLEDKSYDLDHQSKENKGIVEWEYKWRKDDTLWAKGLPNDTDIEPGQKYYVNLRVKDEEGAWSDPILKEYETETVLEPIPLTLEAKLKPQDSSNSLNHFKPDNSVIWWDIQTNYWHNDIRLEVSLWNGSNQIGTTKVVNYDPAKVIVDGFNIQWNDIAYYIQSNLVQHNKIYNIKITAIDNQDESNRAEVVKPITVYKNSPPQITALNITPNFIYEGDKVKATFQVEDDDQDKLTVVLEAYKNNILLADDTYEIEATNGVYDVQNITVDNKAKQGVYTFKVRVTDPYGEEDSAEITYVVNELNITGRVKHTELWNENRLKFNQRKDGNANYPRDYNTFWSGEAFVLEADTTDIDPLSGVYAQWVHVEIIDDPKYNDDYRTFEAYLTSNNNLWTGKIAEEGMMFRWGYYDPVILTFRFTVLYSNGTVKTDDVQITVDSRETYWQERRAW